MKIKTLNSFATAKKAFVLGREYDVTDAQAHEFVKAGLAEHVKPPEEPKAEEPKAKAK